MRKVMFNTIIQMMSDVELTALHISGQAPADDLLRECIPRTREHTEYCVNHFPLQTLREEYGIVGDLVVR